jgi:uncharacterized protein (TIGR03067 family)
MRRTVCLLAVVLIVPPSLGFDSPKAYDGATVQVDELEGTWRLVAVEFNGIKMVSDHLVYAFRSGTITFKVRGAETWRGSYRTDPTRKPSDLDMYATKWIYQIDGDMLWMAYVPFKFRDSRPTGFDDQGISIQTFKRVKE